MARVKTRIRSADPAGGVVVRGLGMNLFISISLSLAFGVFWMWWYYRQDLYEKEPKRFVAFIFLISMPWAILTGLGEYILNRTLGMPGESSAFLPAAFFALGVVAVAEELAKFLVVYVVAYPNRAFNEPMDGIIYATAAALGFASLENVFYALDQGPLVLLLRGPFSTLGHVLFSVMWGAALGRTLNEKEPRRRSVLVLKGLLLAILFHGAYNILISLGNTLSGTGFEWLALSGPAFLVLLYGLVRKKINFALKISIFNPINKNR